MNRTSHAEVKEFLTALSNALDSIRIRWDDKDAVRERALQASRIIIRQSSIAIKHVHRGERERACEIIHATKDIVAELRKATVGHPDVWVAGFVQDALRELTEAAFVYALLFGEPLPTPDELGVDDAPYVNGLAEAVGELRRAALECIRRGDIDGAERLLAIMDEIYFLLIPFDHTDAITQGLRRRVDQVRTVVERTRSDVTVAVQYARVAHALEAHRINEHRHNG